MEDRTTAKQLWDAKDLLDRQLGAKALRRALERVKAGHTLLRVEEVTRGGRPGVSLVWSEGPAEYLPATPTYVRLMSPARSAVEQCPQVDARLSEAPARTHARQRGAGRPAVRGSSRRSSARSGDSGADDDGLAEPPSAGPAERRPSERSRTHCNAPGCNNSIVHLASTAWFCDDRVCVNKREADRKARKRGHVREERALEDERQAERDFEAGLPGRAPLCDCKPPRLFEPRHCNLCGHDLEHHADASLNGSKALGSRLVVVHQRHRPRKPTRYGDRKRKPVEHKTRLPSGEVVAV